MMTATIALMNAKIINSTNFFMAPPFFCCEEVAAKCLRYISLCYNQGRKISGDDVPKT